jgi:hypothetical protein
MLKNIELQKNVITVESLAMFRPNQKTLDRLGGFYTDASEAISKLLGSITSSNAAVAVDGREFLPLIKNSDFTSLSALQLTFPKELSTDYATALQVMTDVAVVPESLYRDVLEPFAKWLALTLNDPKAMESVNQFVSIDVNRAKNAREQLAKVTRGGGSESVRYSRAIRRNSDWEKVISQVNQIAANNANVKIDDIRTKIKEIDDMLQILIGKLNEPRFEYRPTGTFVDRLVSLTYAMAAEVEFYAEFEFLFGKVLSAVRDDVTFLTKKLK